MGGGPSISHEEQSKINTDLDDFFESMSKTDSALRNAGNEDQENRSIYSNGENAAA